MQKITPFLWFDNQAEEAAAFYVSLFPDAKINDVSYYGEGAPLPAGTAMSVNFQLADQEYMALNGGPYYTFSPAISFFVRCETQAEVDHYWDSLLVGGTPEQCGWLKDKYGLTWQIVPIVLGELLGDPDPARAQRVLQAMLQMVKLDIAGLQAAAGEG